MNPDTVRRKESESLDWLRAANQAEARMKQHQQDDYKMRLDLLYKVGKKIGSNPDVSKLLDQVLRMTQQALRASASSVLLIDRNKQELSFQTAEGEARSKVRQIKLDLDSGIAGWVARHASSLVINDVNKDPRFDRSIDKTTGFVTRSVLAVPLVWGQEVIGVLEVLNKLDGSGFTSEDLQVSSTLAAITAGSLISARLHQAVLDGYKGTVKALAAAIDARDPYTHGHSQRVMEYALLSSASFSLSPEEIQVIEFGGLLHDIGKIGVADSILRKPDRLTSEEWSAMRQHPLIGAKIIDQIPFLQKARDLVLQHHERYDGTGYPQGLKGEKITLGARLLAVADAFDTITTDRSYRAALSTETAMGELNKYSGSQFCPVAVKAFITAFNEYQKMHPESNLEGKPK